MDNPQKITRLEINNLLRISVAEIMPDGNLVILSGPNGAGKSSAISAVEVAFAGAGAIPDVPIKQGASRGHVIAETEDLIVTRKFTAAGGSSLTVTTREGVPLSSPQSILDKLTGALCFDPANFLRMTEREPDKALEILKRLVGLDFSALNVESTKIYTERTVVNREAKTLEGKVAAYQHHPGVPEEVVSVVDLTNKLQEARNHNRKAGELQRAVAERKQAAETCSHATLACTKEIHELQTRLTHLQAKLSDLVGEEKTALVATAATIKAAEEFVMQDEQPLLLQIADSDSVNEKVRSNARRKELQKELQEKKSVADKLTSRIEQIDKEKSDALAKVKFPIKELSFSDSTVLLNGLPFKQASTAERLRASIAIGMALNPKLRVMLIRDGNDLDENSLKIVAEMAQENGVQVWLEAIDSRGRPSVVFEDGQIKE